MPLMKHCLTCLFAAAALGLWFPLTAWADEALRDALAAIDKGDSAAAVKLLDGVLAADAKNADAYYHRGRERFRLGEIDASLADFDRVAELKPERERELWERGISHYYAGRYEDGAKQFELYQTYHDNDVENSVWRYLCVARKDGVAKARATMLPIENDRRVPLMEIYALYQGNKKPEDVTAAAAAGKPNERELNARLFYAHLYLGLWHEAAGNAEEAKKHIMLAAKEHKISHYMHDVARVHAARLEGKD